MTKFTIFHPVEIAIEYSAANAAEARDKAARWQANHTVYDMLDMARDIYTLEPKVED